MHDLKRIKEKIRVNGAITSFDVDILVSALESYSKAAISAQNNLRFLYECYKKDLNHFGFKQSHFLDLALKKDMDEIDKILNSKNKIGDK